MCHLGDLNKYMSDTNISMCPTGDLNKNKSAISRRSVKDKFVISISSVLHPRDVNKHKFVIGICRYEKLLYGFLKIQISVIVL